MKLGQRDDVEVSLPAARRGESLLPDADLRFYPHLFEPTEALRLLHRLRSELAFESRTIRLFGREIAEPRMVAWHGDNNAVYTYSGRRNVPQPWTLALLEVRARVESFTQVRFNSVLANLYRDGNDSMGFHSDDEKELGPNPVVASVSLGAARRIRFQYRKEARSGARMTRSFAFVLHDASLLMMGRDVQRLYRHAIPKVASSEMRLNLTFRWVYS